MAAKPDIRVDYDAEPSAHQTNGEIVFTKQESGRSRRYGGFRDGFYIIDGFCYYESTSSDQTIQEMIAELRRVFDTNNNLGTQTYDWEIIQEKYNGSFLAGIITFKIEAVLLMESAI